MKKILLIILIISSHNVFSQSWLCTINFDTSYNCGIMSFNDTAWVDTVTFPNHVWQIGKPHKTIFNSARSLPNAIVTKLNTPYPINDTSSFVIRQRISMTPSYPYTLGIAGWYKVNTDSLKDYGFIEFSPNNGHSWYNLMNDSIIWLGGKPTFSGNNIGWNSFGFMFDNFLGYTFNAGDTICFKFTFISDSIQTNKEGLMIDDILLNFMGEGIKENINQIILSISPNPTIDNLTIDVSATLNIPAIIEITNIQGQVIKQQTTNVETTNIDVSALAKGMYFVKVKTEKGVESRKFVKE